MRAPKCNSEVKRIISETGVLLFEKSVRDEKGSLDDEECLFRHAEKLSVIAYPAICI